MLPKVLVDAKEGPSDEAVGTKRRNWWLNSRPVLGACGSDLAGPGRQWTRTGLRLVGGL